MGVEEATRASQAKTRGSAASPSPGSPAGAPTWGAGERSCLGSSTRRGRAPPQPGRHLSGLTHIQAHLVAEKRARPHGRGDGSPERLVCRAYRTQPHVELRDAALVFVVQEDAADRDRLEISGNRTYALTPSSISLPRCPWGSASFSRAMKSGRALSGIPPLRLLCVFRRRWTTSGA